MRQGRAFPLAKKPSGEPGTLCWLVDAGLPAAALQLHSISKSVSKGLPRGSLIADGVLSRGLGRGNWADHPLSTRAFSLPLRLLGRCGLVAKCRK